MITLASVMTGTDFRKTGVTLEDLGIARMDRQMLNAYLREGVYSE
jgi:opine dehydrogenase